MPDSSTALVPAAASLIRPVVLVPRADERPARVYLAGLAPGSRPAQAGALRTLAAILAGEGADPDALPWGELRYPHAQLARQELAARFAPATANRHLTALRRVLREAYRLGQMGADDYHRATAVANIKGTRLLAGRALEQGELRALFQDCARDPHPARGGRDAALLAVLYGAGLRRAEAAALDIADLDRATGALTVHAGKGNRDRLVYATDGGRAALDAWLAVRGEEPGALFCPVKGGRVAVRRLSGPAVALILERRARRASIARPFSPHDLRRTFVGDLLDAGADIATVQRLAGHANVTTTRRYDRRGEQAKRKAAALLHVPYVPVCT